MQTAQAPPRQATGDKIEGGARQVLGHLLWVVPAVAALALYYARNFGGLYFNDAMDLAQLGRHLQAGHGYVTSVIRPLSWALNPNLLGPDHPELYQAPLFPLLLALFFTVFGATEVVVAAASALCHLAALLMVYLLGRRLFGHTAGALAAVLVAVNLQLVSYAVSGLATPLALFLVTLGVYLLYVNRESARRTALVGVVFGLACLAEYACVGLAAAALVLALLLPSARRVKHLVGYLLGMAVVLAPWAYRNAVVTGNPFFTLKLYWFSMFNMVHPGSSLLRSADLQAASPLRFLVEHPLAVAYKWLLGTESLLATIPAMVGLYLAAFLVAGLLRRVPEPRLMLLRNWAVLTLVWQMALVALFNPAIGLLVPLVGVLAALATGYFLLLGQELGRGRWRWATALLVVVAAYPLLCNVALGQRLRGVSLGSLDYLKRNFVPSTIVVTDVPWAVAWHTELTSVWIPTELKDTDRIDRRSKIGAIYLSATLPTYPAAENVLLWQTLYKGTGRLQGFELQASFPPGEYIFRRTSGAARNGGER